MATDLIRKATRLVRELPARIRVAAGSVVAVTTAAATLCTVVATELGETWPAAGRVLVGIGGLCAAVAVAVRQVTPVPPEQRGILPPAPDGDR